MLQDIRDRAQSWIMWVMFVLITVPFALWGVHQYFGPGGELVVASVNDRPISGRAYQQALQQQRFRLQSTLGSGFDLDEAGEKRLKQETLNRLVEEEVLVDTAATDGMVIGDEQLAYLIHGVDAFKVNGQFSREQYERWLRSQGYVSEGFEQSFRRSLLIGQLQTGVAGTAFLTKPERERLVGLQDQKRSFAYLAIPVARYLDQVQVTEQQVEDYYRQHPAELMRPEQVDVEYVELSRQAIAAGIAVSEEELRQRYETHKSSYSVPEQRQARHVLLRLAEDADPQAVEVTQARARELRARLKAGESFEELAKTVSEDPGSAQAGGELGFFARGAMVAPFENAVFALQVGEISEPVRTPFGVHIIRLDGVRPGGEKPFESVRADVLREVQLERSEPVFFEQAERLANLAFEYPDSLEPAAKALGLPVRSTGLFARTGGSGLTAEPKLISAAFSDEVLQQGHNSEPVELRGGRVVVLREKEYQAAAQRPLEEVRAEVVTRLKTFEAATRASAAARAAAESLRQGTDPAEVARQQSAEWVEVRDAGRQASELDPAILARAFELPRPQSGRETPGTAELASGDAALIALRSVTEGQPASAAERRLDQVYGRLLYDALVETLRRQADVEIFSERL